MTHIDEGRLRMYLDDAFGSAEQATIAAHLGSCVGCQARIEQLRRIAQEVDLALPAPQSVNPQRALVQLRQRQANTRTTTSAAEPHLPRQTWIWRDVMERLAYLWTGPRRMVAGGLAAAVIALSLLVFPPVRAAASRVLDVFRMQRVIPLPISPERIAQLENLDFDGKTLFVAEPEIANQPAPPRTVASAADASQSVGFPVQELTALPDEVIDTQTVVMDRSVFQFQINVESARHLLALLDIHDVTLPDSLGAQPIVADVSPWTETRYNGLGYDLDLYQGHSPTMTLPEGVNLQELGRAALRLLGMDPMQADSLSRQIDWSSTFIFPIPPDVSNLRQVTIDGAQGLLVGGGSGRHQEWLLYWQRDDRFYVLEGQGEIDEDQMIAAAESLR